MCPLPLPPSALPNVLFRGRGLSKVYVMGEVEVDALRDIYLDIYEGEFVVLLGPNAANVVRPFRLREILIACPRIAVWGSKAIGAPFRVHSAPPGVASCGFNWRWKNSVTPARFK